MSKNEVRQILKNLRYETDQDQRMKKEEKIITLDLIRQIKNYHSIAGRKLA